MNTSQRYLSFLLMASLILALSGCDTPTDNGGSYSNGYTAPTHQNYHKQPRMVPCPLCNGTGMWNLMPGDAMAYVTCNLCNGTGRMSEEDAYKYMEAARELQRMSYSGGMGNHSSGNQSGYNPPICPICHGSGRCDGCAGRGWKTYVNGYAEDCTRCRGTGQCQNCYGRGHL